MQVEQQEGYAKIVLPEVIDLTKAPEFKKVLRSLYDQNCIFINIDCCRLEMIDSTGIGSLVLHQKRFQERGGEIRLMNVNNDYIKHLFEMIDLQQVIRID